MNVEEVQRMKQRFRLIGNAPELNRAIDVAIQVAPTDLSVLITGESGIGKSETALELIRRGHRLVADDAVEI